MKRHTASDIVFRLISVMALAISGYLLVRSPAEQRSGTTRTTALESIARTGTLRVAVVPAPPVTTIDPVTREASGYAVDVIRSLATNAGLKPEFHPADWSTFGADLASSKADIAIGPIFFTDGRAKELGLVSPLFSYGVVAVAPASDTRFASITTLSQPGLRVSVGRGGFDEEFVTRRMPDAMVKAFPPGDATLPMLEVASGRADLAIVDYATAEAFVREHPEMKVLFGGEPVSIQYAGFTTTRDDLSLKAFLDNGLRNLDLSGELSRLDALYSKRTTWFSRLSQRLESSR